MIDQNIELADAVCAYISDTLDDGFDLAPKFRGIRITRDYLPQIELATIEAAPQVFVVPKSEDTQPTTRRASQADREVHIGVVQKLVRDANGKLDRDVLDRLLGELCFSIKERVKFHNVVGAVTGQSYKWIRTQHEPLFDPGHLDKYPQFTTLITLTYRVVE